MLLWTVDTLKVQRENSFADLLRNTAVAYPTITASNVLYGIHEHKRAARSEIVETLTD